MKSTSVRAQPLNLKAGEWVVVRSQEEILATLDERGWLDSLPFMPEMLQYCGQKLQVFKRADKTCDTVVPWSIRRMENTVHLETRCDGSRHGGCEAGCLIFWKEAWLKRTEKNVVPSETIGATRPAAKNNGVITVENLLAASQKVNGEGELTYTCQATELHNFTSEMKWWDPRQYIRDIRSGNLASGFPTDSKSEQVLEKILIILKVIRAFVLSRYRENKGISYPPVAGTQVKTPLETLNLQPGELVQVRSREEIVATLDKNKRNRGLLFDGEMLPFCGGIYRVLRRVHHIVDERTGKMMDMKNPCIVLEGVYCKSDYNRFCPRAIYCYWRENWLSRVPAFAPPTVRCEEREAEACSQ
jgi:predicted DNA-binding antitoxin AbrB/MazE fold protein